MRMLVKYKTLVEALPRLLCSFLLWGQLGIGGTYGSAAGAEAVSCATVTLQNDSFAQAKSATEECHLLVAVFDLSHCSDRKVLHPAKVECHGESAVASIQTRSARHEARLTRIVGARNNSLWDLAPKVRQISLVSQTSSPPSATTTSRAPASVLGLNEAQQSIRAQKPPSAPTPATSTSEPNPSLPSPTTSPPSSLSIKIPPTLSISGLFDIYYSQNFNHPAPVTQPTASSPNLPTQQNQMHNFDLYSNQLSLNLAELSLKNTGKEVSYLVDLDFGQQADYISKLSSGVPDGVTKNIGQALLSYTPESLSRLTIAAGKMYTNMGYETPKSINNWQYSRSFLFSNGLPYWHVGVSASYAIVPNVLTATAFVYDGWNTIYNSNSGNDVALQLTYSVNSAITLTYNGIEGPQQANENNDVTQIHELIGTYNASDKLQFALDGIDGWAGRSYANQGNAKWWASSLAAKYQFHPLYSLSPRVELYEDPDGYTTGTPQTLTSYTLTQATKLKDGLEPRIELRYDHSSVSSFQTSGANKSDQVTLTFAAIYGF